jgi:RHS repeat-associated protein
MKKLLLSLLFLIPGLAFANDVPELYQGSSVSWDPDNEEVTFSWFGTQDRTYFLLYTNELSMEDNWEYLPGIIEIGEDLPIEYTFEGAETSYFKLRWTDDPYVDDLDGDGVSNEQEIENGLDPFSNVDTDGDGISDDKESMEGGDLMDPTDGFPLSPAYRGTNLILNAVGTWPSGSSPLPNISFKITDVETSAIALEATQADVLNGTPTPGQRYFINKTAYAGDFPTLIPVGKEYSLDICIQCGQTVTWPAVFGRVQDSVLVEGQVLDYGNVLVENTIPAQGTIYWMTNPSGFSYRELDWSTNPFSQSLANQTNAQQVNSLNFSQGTFWLVNLDLDVDSDNTNNQGIPERSIEEDDLETTTPKYIQINNDDDNNNSIADRAELLSGDNELYPVILEVAPASLPWDKIKIKFNYPGEAEYEDSQDYGVRLWNITNANATRTAAKYIKPGEAYTPEDLGLSEDHTQIKVMLEGCGLSAIGTDFEIEAVFLFKDAKPDFVEYFRDKVKVAGRSFEGGPRRSRPADASNTEYAHVALNGRPLPGREPMSKAESDMEREMSYVDAFNLQLRHNVTDVYVPIPGSDLALSVRRNWSGEQWNERYGLRPSERPDQPFGAGWSSNVTANIHLIYQETSVLTQTVPANYAYVTDHNGAVYRFVIADTGASEKYFPLPESRIDQETYLSTLTRSGSTFTFKKKHGATLTFTLDTALDLEIDGNRLAGVSSGHTEQHQYAKLNEVEDRLGYTLTYAYSGSGSLIPSTITSFSGQSISISSSGGRINSVTDPRGKTTNYSYTTSGDHGGYAKLDWVRQPQDEDSNRPQTDYTYDLVTEADSTPNTSPTTETPWYHLDLKEIEDPRDKAYTFAYTFDHTAQFYDLAAGFYPVNGRPRTVSSVTLPGSLGSATFANHSYSAIVRDETTGKPTFFGHRGSVVVDTEGYARSYKFEDLEVQELQQFEPSIKPGLNPIEIPRIGLYQKQTVTHYTTGTVGVTEKPDSVTFTGSVGGTEVYNFNLEAGLALASATDMSGNTVSYDYDDTWDITVNHPWLGTLDFPFGKYADPTGKTDTLSFTETWEYDSTWRLLTKYIDKEGRRTDYELGPEGQTRFEKIYETSSGGTPVQSTEMVYGNGSFKGFVTQRIRRTTDTGPQEFDLVIDYVPDAYGRVQDEIVAPGDLDLTTSYEYDLNNNKTKITDPREHITDFEYDDIGRLTKVTYPLITGASVRAEKRMKYDLRGNLLRETDERSNKTHYVYDDLSRLVEQYRDMDGDGPDTDVDLKQSYTYNKINSRLTATDARGNTTTSTYDWAQRLSTLTDADSKITTYGYNIATGNAGGLLFAGRRFQPTTITDPRTYVSTFTYDDNYRLTQVSRQYKLAPSPLFAVTTTAYDKMGNPELVTDPLLKQTETVYDALYRPFTITRALGTADESTVTTHYTTTGLVHQVEDGRGNATDSEYDEAGRLRFVKQPLVDDGSGSNSLRPTTETVYDDASNIIATINPRGALTTGDPDDFRWDYAYDERNRKTDEFGPEVFDYDSSTTQRPHAIWEYDDAGNVTAITDPRGNVTDTHFDAANRPWKVELPAVYDPVSTGMVRPTTITGYDKNGNVETVEDANGHVTTNTYDVLNRLKTTEDAEGIVVENFYDAAGNITRVEDGKDQPTIFTYDGLNRNTTVTDAANKVTTFAYDAVNITGRTDAMSPPQVTSYGYDHKHRLTTITYTGRSQDNRVYTYDDNDNLETVTEAGKGGKADVEYAYDALNRVETEESQGQTHTYRYDVAGNRVFVEYGGTGTEVTSTYDEANRPDTVTEGGRTTTYRYDLNGNNRRKILGNAETVTQVFDAANRPTSQIGATGTPTQLYSYAYEYDLKGNLTTSTEDYAASGVADRTVVNTYEDNDRLDTETITTGAGSIVTDYGYDDANNRTSKVVTGGGNPGTTSYVHNSLNQLTSYTLPSSSTVTLTYDFNGNRATKTGGLTYGYDYENRLVSLTGGATNYAYVYDYRTRRVERTEGATVTSVVFSGGLSVQEIESSATTVEYIRGSDMGGGIGGILYTLRSGSPSYNHYNSRGDVSTKTSSASAVTYQAAYEAFGTRTEESGSTADRQKANTKEEDPTGLKNEGFRYFDLEASIFLTRDPLGFVDGPNLYTYVVQNPWSKFDPEGLSERRIDPDGFEWKGSGQHIVPRQVARDAGWTKEAKEIFDDPNSKIKKGKYEGLYGELEGKYGARIATPAGHNYTKHSIYNAEVGAEMAEFLQEKFREKGANSLSQFTAKEQRQMAIEFLERMKVTDNQFIRGFNQVVHLGPAQVARWVNEHGSKLILKSTGKLVGTKGAKIVSGIAGHAGTFGGAVIRKGAPIVSMVIVGGVGIAQGKSSDEINTDMFMSVTSGDIAESIVQYLAAPGAALLEETRTQHEQETVDQGFMFRNP